MLLDLNRKIKWMPTQTQLDKAVLWFHQNLQDGVLPSSPFELASGAIVDRPEAFYECLEEVIVSGADHPFWDALWPDLCLLKRYVDKDLGTHATDH